MSTVGFAVAATASKNLHDSPGWTEDGKLAGWPWQRRRAARQKKTEGVWGEYYELIKSERRLKLRRVPTTTGNGAAQASPMSTF